MDGEFELRKFVVPEFVFGSGARSLLGRYLKNFAAKKIFLVTDRGCLIIIFCIATFCLF